MDTLRFSLCLLLLLAQAAVAPELQAQQEPPGTPTPSSDEVLVFSYIGPGEGSGITTYSATEMGANVAAYYDVEVYAYLYQGTGITPIGFGSAQGNGNDIAEGSINAASAAALFVVDSYHYLLPYYQDEETGEYLDPYGFAEAGFAPSIGESIVTGTADPDNYPTGETFDSQIYLGETWWQTYGVAPQINSINATCSNCAVPLVLGSSGTLTIIGVYLTADGTDQNPTVSLSPMGAGLTLGPGPVTVVSDGELEVSYSVGSSPSSTGQYGITVTTNAGTSNTSNVKVGDPTPSIGSITPDSWNAGATTTFAIAGSGFGTNPMVTFTGLGVGTAAILPTPTDNLITVSVPISAAGNGVATITVQSQGYNASGFLPAQSGQTGLTQGNATIIPFQPGTPQIMFGVDSGGSVCSAGPNIGSPQTVVVGQLIAFTACIPSVPAGTTIASMSWSPLLPQGSAVGGYNVAPDNSSGTVVPLSVAICGLTSYCDFPAFYWVDQAPAASPRQFTFSYTLSNGKSASAVASFVVNGPAAPNIVANIGSMQALPVDPSELNAPGLRLNGPRLPNGQTVGVIFTTQADVVNGNAGTHSWVQLIQSDHVQVLNPAAAGNGKGGVQTCLNFQGPGVDNNYPYPTFTNTTPYDTAVDSPDVPLIATYAEEQRLFSATMYLMWDPTLPGPGQAACSAASDPITNAAGAHTPVRSTCTGSIPIPLASVAWTAAGDAINTLQTQPPPPGTAFATGTTFTNACGPGTAQQPCAVVVPNTPPAQSFPVWNVLYANVVFKCQ